MAPVVLGTDALALFQKKLEKSQRTAGDTNTVSFSPHRNSRRYLHDTREKRGPDSDEVTCPRSDRKWQDGGSNSTRLQMSYVFILKLSVYPTAIFFTVAEVKTQLKITAPC